MYIFATRIFGKLINARLTYSYHTVEKLNVMMFYDLIQVHNNTIDSFFISSIILFYFGLLAFQRKEWQTAHVNIEASKIPMVLSFDFDFDITNNNQGYVAFLGHIDFLMGQCISKITKMFQPDPHPSY